MDKPGSSMIGRSARGEEVSSPGWPTHSLAQIETQTQWLFVSGRGYCPVPTFPLGDRLSCLGVGDCAIRRSWNVPDDGASSEFWCQRYTDFERQVLTVLPDCRQVSPSLARGHRRAWLATAFSCLKQQWGSCLVWLALARPHVT